MTTLDIFTGVINSSLPQPHSSLLNGIVWGINLKDHPLLYEELKIVGLLHIVVLSGANISLLTTLVGKSLSYFGKKLSTLLTILIVILFVLLVSPQAPVVRAAFMNLITFVAYMLGKRSQALYCLMLSGFIIAIIWPAWITSLSFQLSFGATLGLIIFTSPELPDKKSTLLGSLIEYLKSELRTSIAAQVFTVPLIFLHFQQISLISPLSNILVAWTIGPLMVAGILTSLVGVVSPFFAKAPMLLAYWLLNFDLLVVHYLSHIPYALIEL